MTEHYHFYAGFRAAVTGTTMSAALLSALLSGCASAPPGVTYGTNPRDPWESYNRTMTNFNDSVNKNVLKPVVTAYTDVVPSPVRTGVLNFFGNLSDAWSFVNNVLEANSEGALYSFWRVAVNTTFGLGGILDPATEMRLDRHRKDFGLTLGRWGIPPGPYLVLPILGPSTLRDTAGLPVDLWWGNPTSYIQSMAVRNSLLVLSAVNTSTQLLSAADLLNQAALDPYSFTRDAWLQKRRNDLYNGNPPPDADDEKEDAIRYDQPEAPASAASAAGPVASTASADMPDVSAAAAVEPAASAAEPVAAPAASAAEPAASATE